MAQELGLIPCGFLPSLPEGELGSRHLGLITAQEVEGLEEKLQVIGRAAEEHLEMDALCRLAFQAPPLEYQNLWESEPCPETSPHRSCQRPGFLLHLSG